MDKVQKALSVMTACFDFVGPDKAKAYYLMLRDLPEDAVAAAIGELIRTECRCPPVSLIREKTQAILDTAAGKEAVDVGAKWERFNRACLYGDYYDPLHFPDDPVLERVARMFSLEEVRRCPPSKVAILRKQFMDRYRETMAVSENAAANKKIIERLPALAKLAKSVGNALGWEDGHERDGTPGDR